VLCLAGSAHLNYFSCAPPALQLAICYSWLQQEHNPQELRVLDIPHLDAKEIHLLRARLTQNRTLIWGEEATELVSRSLTRALQLENEDLQFFCFLHYDLT